MAMGTQRLYHMILGTNHHQPAAAHWLAAGASIAAMPMSSGPFHGLVALPSPTLGVRRLDGDHEMTTNKGKRDEQSLVLGADQVEQQILDRNVRNQDEKFWNTLEQERHRQEKQLWAKDQEIMQTWGVNRALEECIRTLYMEDQAWRMDAQYKQNAANVLHPDLERSIAQQAARYHGCGRGDGEEDAESCCWGENHVALCREVEVEMPVVEPQVTRFGMCKRCGESAPVVVLLPCRHLSVCDPCADVAWECPSCGCAKQGSICINFS